MDDILEINKNNIKFKVINDNDKFWIKYLNNKWENSFFKNINSEHYKDKDFIDIGSSNGCISLFSCFFFKKVIALDPEIKFFEILKENLKLNPSIKNIFPIHGALGTDSKTMRFEPNDHFNEIMFAEKKNYNVDIISLRDLLKKNSINQKFFLKIDIEGYEFNLLNDYNFMSIIKQNKPDIYIGIHIGFSSLFKYKKSKFKFLKIFLNLDKTIKEYLLIYNLIKNYKQIIVDGKKVSKFFFLNLKFYRKNVNMFLKN